MFRFVWQDISYNASGDLSSETHHRLPRECGKDDGYWEKPHSPPQHPVPPQTMAELIVAEVERLRGGTLVVAVAG
jgi:hypothetical protein